MNQKVFPFNFLLLQILTFHFSCNLWIPKDNAENFGRIRNMIALQRKWISFLTFKKEKNDAKCKFLNSIFNFWWWHQTSFYISENNLFFLIQVYWSQISTSYQMSQQVLDFTQNLKISQKTCYSLFTFWLSEQISLQFDDFWPRKFQNSNFALLTYNLLGHPVLVSWPGVPIIFWTPGNRQLLKYL